MSAVRTAIVDIAKEELKIVAGRHETDPVMHPILMKYWTNGPQEFEGNSDHKKKISDGARQDIKDRTAWSAAFVSYVVRKALAQTGSAAEFAFSASHSVYAGQAIRNGLVKPTLPAFIGYPPTGIGAVKPEVGDLIGVTRVKWVDDFADALDAARNEKSYFSHFDIVTDISGDVVSKIGGNVSDSVTQTTVKTQNGILPILKFKHDKTGRIVSGPFICVIKLEE